MAARIIDAVHQLERALIEALVGRLRVGIDRDDWATQRWADAQLLRRRLTTGVQQATPALLAQVQQLVHDAYNHGQTLAVADLQDADLDWHPVPDPMPAIGMLGQQAATTVQGALQLAPDLLMNVYSQAVHAASLQVLGGQLTRVQAAQQVLDRLAARGITGYRDTAGRSWSLESYAEMAVRTSTGHAAVQGHVDSLAAAGEDLVIVSDAPRECPLCRPWERRVLSITGRVGRIIEPDARTGTPTVIDVAGSLEQARAAGFQHPNCRHTIAPYLPGVTKTGNAVADPTRYEAGQRQREIERKIREWKRRQLVALDGAAARQAAGKVRAWQAALREHVDQHDLTRLRRREQIGRAL